MRNSSLKRSDMAHVNEGSRSFTCHPHVYHKWKCGINYTCLYSPAAERHRTLAGTHFPSAEDRRLNWLEWLVTNRGAWFTSPQTVTHPSTNRAWRRVTSLIETSTLPLSQAVWSVFWAWTTVCKTVRPMLLDHCLSVRLYNVGALWPNGWMGQGANWCEGRPRPRPHCVRWGPGSPPPKRGTVPSIFAPCLLWPNGCPSRLLLSTC